MCAMVVFVVVVTIRDRLSVRMRLGLLVSFVL